MKKIFGLMSLIAILTVSFTAQASTTVDDAEVIVSVDDGSVSLDATSVAIEVSLDSLPTDLSSAGGVLTVAGCPVSSIDVGGSLAEVVPIVPSIGSSPDIFALVNSTNFDVPDVIPLDETGVTIKDKNETVNKCNELSEWFGTHTGKINCPTNIS